MNFETLINVNAIWHDDITFCQEECDWTDCMRNKKNIRDKTIPHSFSVDVPEDCPKKGCMKSMLKNFVIVKHFENSGKYLFLVPKSVSLSAGDNVVCDTARGNDQLGVCCCDSFLADPNVVVPLFGVTQAHMKYITGKVEYERFQEAREEEEDAERENG